MFTMRKPKPAQGGESKKSRGSADPTVGRLKNLRKYIFLNSKKNMKKMNAFYKISHH
jgi:hypothetical protein